MPAVFQVIAANITYATPANPTGTSNTSGLHAGLAVALTPQVTGRVNIRVCGNLSNSTGTAGNGCKVQIRYGTGSAPANAAALTGTAVGTVVSALLERATANDPLPFALEAVVSGLTLGTAYWFDISEAAIAAGTGTVTNIMYTVEEK